VTIIEMGKIVEHQVRLDLSKRGLSKHSLKLYEYNYELYQMALKLLVELR